MKIRSILVLTVCFLCFSGLPAFAAPGFAGSDSNRNFTDLVAELRGIYQLALDNRAASPGFLLDLEDLILRFESSLLAQGNWSPGDKRLLSGPVQVRRPAGHVGSKDDVGKIFYFLVKGATGGNVWGSGVYTNDTNIAVAAVHAGILRTDEKRIVAVRVLPGQQNYESSTRHGITSSSYGKYDLSYEFVPIDEASLLIEEAGPLSDYNDMVGQSLVFQVTGQTNGALWGTGIYTLDSNLAVAAVHAGLVRPGETAAVLVEFLPGQESYRGTANFGVSSRDYHNYPSSYRLAGIHF